MGKLGPKEYNDSHGYPYSWIDMNDGVERARVIVSGEVDCENVGIQVGFLSAI